MPPVHRQMKIAQASSPVVGTKSNPFPHTDHHLAHNCLPPFSTLATYEVNPGEIFLEGRKEFSVYLLLKQNQTLHRMLFQEFPQG